jgi:4-amino-4-deoxy-L-arabinose transferase-like glycosyltransferase
LILVVAALLRFEYITQPLIDPFCWRQSSTAMMAENYYLTNWNIFYPEVNWSGPGPNYQGREFQTVTYISALLYVVFGQHDWIGRSVAVLFGLWGIFALYKLIKRLSSEKHAMISAAVMAVLPGSVFIERSFLPDPVMVSLMTTSVWMFVTYLQTERLRCLLLACLIGMLGILTKLPGAIIGLPMAYAMIVIGHRKGELQIRKILLVGIAAGCTLIPVVAYYIWARHLSYTYPPYHFAGSNNWLWDSNIYIWWKQERYFIPRLYQILRAWLWTYPVILLVLLGVILPFITKNREANHIPFLFHWWLIAMGIYYFIGAQELTGNPWNFHLVNPAAAALAGYAIYILYLFAQSATKSRYSTLAVILILFVIGLNGRMHLRSMYYPYAQEEYALGKALHTVSKPGHLVVTLAKSWGDPVAIFYSQRRGWAFPPVDEWGDGLWLVDDNEAIKILKGLQNKGANWLGIVTQRYDDIINNRPALADYIKNNYLLEQSNQYWVIYQIPPINNSVDSLYFSGAAFSVKFPH